MEDNTMNSPLAATRGRPETMEATLAPQAVKKAANMAAKNARKQTMNSGNTDEPD